MSGFVPETFCVYAYTINRVSRGEYFEPCERSHGSILIKTRRLIRSYCGACAGCVKLGSPDTQQSPTESSGQMTRHQVPSAVTPVTFAVWPAAIVPMMLYCSTGPP